MVLLHTKKTKSLCNLSRKILWQRINYMRLKLRDKSQMMTSESFQQIQSVYSTCCIFLLFWNINEISKKKTWCSLLKTMLWSRLFSAVTKKCFGWYRTKPTLTQFSIAEDREHKGRRYEQEKPELLNSSRQRLMLGFGELDE